LCQKVLLLICLLFRGAYEAAQTGLQEAPNFQYGMV
jgi:hypothetical protein